MTTVHRRTIEGRSDRTAERVRRQTPATVWGSLAQSPIDDELLDWPPDVYALTETILQQSEAYRFALSPPPGTEWPPPDVPDWPTAVAEASRAWPAWVENPSGPIPDLVAREWEILRRGANTPMEDVSQGRDWRLCQALLTLHAIADESCAGLGVALTASDGQAAAYRARGRELLARTGSLSRLPPELLRVLPKVRTTPSGSSPRSLTRYASLHGPGREARWHKLVGGRPSREPHAQGANFLLLPWPLRIRASDFRPLEHSVHRLTQEPFGFFEFAPSEGLDLELVDAT